MRVGSLFSGIGGIDLGLERAGFEIAWQVETDPYCRRVLGKHWPRTICYDDIRRIDWRTVTPVEVVCGGFPCQPFSVAGKRRGVEDDRYLWPEVVRCLDALRPAWFLGENVPGIIRLALDQVCVDLESLGYTVWPVCIPACAVDAPHIRQRVWILAHTARDLRRTPRDARLIPPHGGGAFLANTTSPVSEWHWAESGGPQGGPTDASWWSVEPDVGRVADGIPNRMDRLKGLGNAVVPQIVEELGHMMREVEDREIR